MRRKRQQLPEQESIDILKGATSGTLALTGHDGYPYAVPISYVYFRSVIAFGRIHIVDDDIEKMTAARLLAERYNPNDEEGFQKEIEKSFAHMLALRFDIEHLTGKEAIELVRMKQQPRQ